MIKIYTIGVYNSTEDSFFKNHDIVVKDMYGNIQFYIKTIELDGDVIFNIEDYLFLLEE